MFFDGNAIYDAPIYSHIDFLKNPILFSVYVFAAVFLAKFNQFVRVWKMHSQKYIILGQ